MSWVVLPTFPVGSLLTSTLMNQIRGDISDLDSRTRPSSDVLATNETTTSTTYTDLATVNRPAVALVTGTAVIVAIRGDVACAAAQAYMGFAVSGSTTVAASDAYAIACQSTATTFTGAGSVFTVTGLTAGTNTFTAKYRATSGTGVFQNRMLTVWPANNLS